MILLVSTHAGEFSTDSVIDWLDYKKVPFKRINGFDFIKKQHSLTVGDKTIFDFNVDDITCVWYRRWLAGSYYMNEYSTMTDHVYLNVELAKSLKQEIATLRIYFGFLFEDVPWLSRMETASVNKLIVLSIAKEVGLEIPKTMVSNNKKSFSDFKKAHGEIITKAISESFALSANKQPYIGYTAVISDEVENELTDTFFPSLAQEAIEKEYELRVFYLDGQMYSMAIFSQLDAQTGTDFRDYNHDKPNRNVPFNLPEDIQNKIRELMQRMKLDTGSVDLIRAKDGRYVFLEINPIGQFGMTSYPCNYGLEEIIADYLTNKSKEYERERG